MQKLKFFLRKKTTTAIVLAMVFVLGTAGISPEVTEAKGAQASPFTIKLKNDSGVLAAVGSEVAKRFEGSSNPKFSNIYSFKSAHSLNELKNILRGQYEYLEPKQILEASSVVVNDPGFTADSLNIDKQWGLTKAGFADAWARTTGSLGNVVAIIDTGIDFSHEDLQFVAHVAGFDFISDQAISSDFFSNSDDNGHGTLVAGVLGASVSNGIGVAGTNWQITLMPIKVLDSKGKGDTLAVAEGIVWATDHGAQFINLSLGGIGFGHDTTLANAVAYAFERNVFIAAAAGNDSAVVGTSLDQTPIFPVCHDNNFNMIVGVAASDQNDLKPAFSNYGKNCVDVTAPGKRILSTINFDPSSQKPVPNSYVYGSGTSLAVPLVVGQAALIKTLYPQATNIQIRDRIISSAEPIDNLNLSQCAGSHCRGMLGAGRINVLKSLESAIEPMFSEWDIVKVNDLNGVAYQIIGGQKRLISSFVHNQRFANQPFKTANFSELSAFPEGPYITPLDGTLVKYDSSKTVYIMEKGLKLPVTRQVFLQRGLVFDNIKTLTVAELNSWPTGNFFPPAEGTLLRGFRDKTVYWVVGRALHPINSKFYNEKGLKIFPIVVMADSEINSFPKGEAYIR